MTSAEARAATKARKAYGSHVSACSVCQGHWNNLCPEGARLNERAANLAGLALLAELPPGSRIRRPD